MRVAKRPVQAIKDADEDCDRSGRNEIEKIGANGHDTLLQMRCVSVGPHQARLSRDSRSLRILDWPQKMFKIIFLSYRSAIGGGGRDAVFARPQEGHPSEN